MGQKLKQIFLSAIFVLSSSICLATDYTQDANCAAAWLLNESSGNAADSCNSFTLTASGDGITYSVTGQYGDAIDFAGTDDFFNRNSVSGTLLDQEDTTISLCIWMNTDSTANNEQSLMRKNQGGDISLIIKNFNELRFELELTSGFKSALTSTFNLSTNTWYHVCGTYDGSNMEVWADGVSVASSSQTASISGADGAESFQLAVQPTNLADFDGTLDDGLFMTDKLTSVEINEIKDNGIEGSATVERRITFMMAKRKDAILEVGSP